MTCDPIVDGKVPTLDDPYAGTGEPMTVADAFTDPYNGGTDRYWDGYYVVAADPDRTMFFDDDAQAIAVSNYNAARDALGDAAVELGFWTEYATCGQWVRYLIAGPDKRDVVQDLLSRLADYPLLDEMDYSKRDHDAWSEGWEQFGRADVVKSVAAELDRRGAGYLAELVQWDDLPIDDKAAQESMNYCYGLRGEYDHDGAVGGALLAAMDGAQAF